MARKKTDGKFNKSQAIRETAATTGLIGQKLAEELLKLFPDGFAGDSLEGLTAYCSSILSNDRKKAQKAKAKAKSPSQDSKPGAAASDTEQPFITQLRSLTKLIGRKAVKEMVDKL